MERLPLNPTRELRTHLPRLHLRCILHPIRDSGFLHLAFAWAVDAEGDVAETPLGSRLP